MASLEQLTRAAVPLGPYCTLRAGGPAERFAEPTTIDELAELAILAQRGGHALTMVGGGSNLLPSDRGVPGVVLHNRTGGIEISPDGLVVADSGVKFQELFLKTAQAGFGGFEYAVGIPGSIGGALASNAGAYRSNISEFLTGVDLVVNGERAWMDPSWLQLSYRDSILRRPDAPPCAVLRLKFKLEPREPKAIYDEAREYQRQRISKQPGPASAGSFFKNVNDQTLADRLPNLPARLKEAGVVPAGYLIEHAGLAGTRYGGAMLAQKHANFMLNVGGASAHEIRSLSHHARAVVQDRYGVTLEEEVLYLGDWQGWIPGEIDSMLG